MTGKRYRDWSLDQPFLLPPSLLDWVAADHLVLRLVEVVGELDLTKVTVEVDGKDPRGVRPYNPRMMTALILYGYCQGIYSARKLGAAVCNRVDFRVLTANQTPHFTAIHRFRKCHREALKGLLPQVVAICERAGLISLEHLSIDGTKISAATSKHKAMSFGRMKDEISRLEKLFEEMLDASDAADKEEDELYGEGRDAHELEPELKRAEERLRRIREAKEELEAEARAARAQDLRERAAKIEEDAGKEEDEVEARRKRSRAKRYRAEAEGLADEEPNPEPDAMPKHRVPTTPTGLPEDSAQVNFTDPDSRIMKRDGSYLQGYNGQIAVDSKSQVIVAVGLSNLAPDQPHLRPMLERIKKQFGRSGFKLTADAGYLSDANIDYCQANGIDAYISTRRRKHGEQEHETERGTALQREMARKLATEEGAKIYCRRKAVVEPVFGQMLWNRCFRRFSFIGLQANSAEFALLAVAHNIMKLLGRGSSSKPSARPTRPTPRSDSHSSWLRSLIWALPRLGHVPSQTRHWSADSSSVLSATAS